MVTMVTLAKIKIVVIQLRIAQSESIKNYAKYNSFVALAMDRQMTNRITKPFRLSFRRF